MIWYLIIALCTVSDNRSIPFGYLIPILNVPEHLIVIPFNTMVSMSELLISKLQTAGKQGNTNNYVYNPSGIIKT